MSNGIFLAGGSHSADSGQKCAMEFVSWVAGETHSDQPHCTCPVIGAFTRRVNDYLPDDFRQQLVPVLLDLVGTNTGDADSHTRAYMCADWGFHVAMRAAFVRLNRRADLLRIDAAPRIVNRQTALAVRDVARALRSAAAAAYAAYAAADAADAAAAAAAAADAADAADAAAAAYAADDADAADDAAAADAYAAAAAAYAAYAAAAAADASRRNAWVELLPSALDLLKRMAAVGRKAEPEMVEERAKQIRNCYVGV